MTTNPPPATEIFSNKLYSVLLARNDDADNMGEIDIDHCYLAVYLGTVFSHQCLIKE